MHWSDEVIPSLLAPYSIPIRTLAAGTHSDDGFLGFPAPHFHMLGVEVSDCVGFGFGGVALDQSFFALALHAMSSSSISARASFALAN